MGLQRLIATCALPLAIGTAFAGPANSAPVGPAKPISGYVAEVECQMLDRAGKLKGHVTAVGAGYPISMAISSAETTARIRIELEHGYSMGTCRFIRTLNRN